MPTRRFSKLTATVTVAATVYALACTTKNNKAVDAHITVHDTTTIDGPPPCLAMASYGTPAFGSNQGAGSYGSGSNGSNAHAIFYDGALNADPMPDFLSVQLFAGYGVFSGTDITVQSSINLATEDADFATCGACVLVETDYNSMAGSGVDPVAQHYLATAGTLALTSVGSGSGSGQTFSGTLTNATFTHVTIDPMTFKSTVVPGCNSAITSATLSGPITYHFTGKDPGALGHRYR